MTTGTLIWNNVAAAITGIPAGVAAANGHGWVVAGFLAMGSLIVLGPMIVERIAETTRS